MGGKLAFVATCLILVSGLAKTGLAADLPGIPPEVVADYLHAVIEADRTFYTIHVVERMQKQGGTPASETWRKDKTTLQKQKLLHIIQLIKKINEKIRIYDC